MLPLGPFRIPDSSATSDLDSVWQWPQAFEYSKNLLGTVHVAGVAVFWVSVHASFSLLTLGDPVVAGKGGDRRQGTEGTGD